MCCRFYIKENDLELVSVIDAAAQSPLTSRIHKTHPTPLVRAGEVKPTNLVAAVATDRKRRRAVFPMLWGFTVQGRTIPLINARSESAAAKPTFQEAWAGHRCAIPVSWYYEWQHAPTEDGRGSISTKYAIQPAGSTVAWLCGLYRIENGVPVFVILTREASTDIAFIHDRMPLILPNLPLFPYHQKHLN